MCTYLLIHPVYHILKAEASFGVFTRKRINNLTLDPITDTSDVPLYVAEKLYVRDGADWTTLPTVDQKDRASDKKKLLNTKAVDKMTLARIRERGAYDEFTLWFNTLKQFTN